MKPKVRILVLCDWFLPGFMAGGPIQSVAALTHHLKDDVEFSIITSDTDFKASAPYPDIPSDTWTTYEGRNVYYISQSHRNAATIETLINSTPHDLVYLNSLYSPLFAIVPLRLRRAGKISVPMILAPRGMLSDGALKTKTFKKNAFIAFAKLTGLFKGITWQSTSPQETKEIRHRIGNHAIIREASNLPNVPGQISPIHKHAGELKLCYVGRICETKNLRFAIDVLKHCRQGSVSLDVYGPIEDPVYWQACQDLALQCPSHVKFNYGGSLQPSEVSKAIMQHHALFLPTHNENFGHAMVESMLCARPIIISDQTPWRALNQEQAGFDISLQNLPAFVNALETAAGWDDAIFQLWSRGAEAYIHKRLSIQTIRQAYLDLFSLKTA